MCRSVVPGNVDRLIGMLLQECPQQFGDLLAAFAVTHQHNGFARVVVHRTNAVASGRLKRRGDHDLLSNRAPHSAERRVPANIEPIRVVEDRAFLQVIALLFDRLFLTG